MTINQLDRNRRPSLMAAFQIQVRVIGALIMRELHTRYGRENIGYLWLIAEPMMLATVISSIHATGHTDYGSDIAPLPFMVVGYTTYIMFRGIVNRSEGSMEANAPLLYHRMVTPFDVTLARALLEVAGTTITYLVLISILTAIGWADLPARPLYLYAAIGLQFWWSWAHSMIVTGISHENRTIGRFVHPYTYFSIPLSGAFYQMEWVPHPYREWLQWYPMPSIFELVRYGQFKSANLDYFHGLYTVGWCAVLTCLGFVSLRMMRAHVHLS